MTTITEPFSGDECERFTLAYAECAAWVAGVTVYDLSSDDAATLEDEAEALLKDEHLVRCTRAAQVRDARYGVEQSAHDAYLTREGHGAGYWDRGLGIVGDALTIVAKAWGSSDFPEYEYQETEES